MARSATTHPEVLAAIALSRRPGVGAGAFKALVDRHGSPSRALATLDDTERSVAGPAATRKADLADVRERLTAQDAGRATWYGAPDYPVALAALSEPPPYLFRDGPLWPLPPVAVAVVGPRQCSETGARVAAHLARWLAARGVLVVSGGALGIDGAAHRATLDAGGWPVLVTATGLDRAYPARHAALFEEVRDRGCLLTELLPGSPPRRDFFPTRNRIVAGLCGAVVVVEGRSEGGTAWSARHAFAAGRRVLAWTESPVAELRSLPAALLARGAAPFCPGAPEVVLAAASAIPFASPGR